MDSQRSRLFEKLHDVLEEGDSLSQVEDLLLGVGRIPGRRSRNLQAELLRLRVETSLDDARLAPRGGELVGEELDSYFENCQSWAGHASLHRAFGNW